MYYNPNTGEYGNVSFYLIVPAKFPDISLFHYLGKNAITE